MKVPYHINARLPAGRAAASRHEHNPAQNPNAFKKLLSDCIRTSDLRRNYPDTALPLNRDQALQLFDIIQVRMNNDLVNAFLGTEDDNGADGFGFDLANISRVERETASYVSKFQQTAPQQTKKPSQIEINNIIAHASKSYNVDPDLITAVVRAESDFDAGCTSPKGAMGLMQLMPETANELGVTDAYDPVENIMAGTRYLKSLIDRYDGNVTLALAAYNWGMGNVERRPEKLPRETSNYIARINNFYQQQKILYL